MVDQPGGGCFTWIGVIRATDTYQAHLRADELQAVAVQSVQQVQVAGDGAQGGRLVGKPAALELDARSEDVPTGASHELPVPSSAIHSTQPPTSRYA